MVSQAKDRWLAEVGVGRTRRRASFATKQEALDAEGDRAGSMALSKAFRSAADLMWKRTKNEHDALAITEELIGLLGANIGVACVTTTRVRQLYLYYRDERRHASSTINRKMSCLSKLLKYCRDEGCLTKLPVIPFTKEPMGRTRCLTEFEEEAIFSKLAPEHRALALFLLYTGCRMGEAMALKWSDVREDRVTFWHTKTGKPRTVPLVRKAKEALEIVRGLGKVVYPFKARYNSFHKDWAQARRASGLSGDPQVVPHILRHTCASRLVIGGADIVRVKEWLGHSTLHVTLRYSHLAPDDLFAISGVLEG